LGVDPRALVDASIPVGVKEVFENAAWRRSR
jgi:hypothetical protein